MPADDLVLNVRQIANYSPGGILPTDQLLGQRGGLGGPYFSVTAGELVGNALASDGPMSVGNPAPADTAAPQFFTDGVGMVLDGQLMWNCYVGGGQEKNVGAGPSARIVVDPTGDMFFQYGQPVGPLAPAAFNDTLVISPTGYLTVFDQALLGRDPAAPLEAATAQWVEGVVAGLRAATVWTFNGRRGDICLWITDIVGAGGAPQFSPVFGGTPLAPTPSPQSCSSRIATTAFVHRNAIAYINGLLKDQPFVFTFNGRAGNVVLTSQDILEAGGGDVFDSPHFTGTPTTTTAPINDNTAQIANSQFVNTAIGIAIGTLPAIYAPIFNPQFAGQPTAPTAAPGTSTAQLATTAYVMAAVTGATAGVATFNTRTGAVELEPADISSAGGALLVSPIFTGQPTAPTAAPGTNTSQLATCAWVLSEIGGAQIGVVSFNGRGGAVILLAADINSAGGALSASPNFSGQPTAPTAPTGVSTNQIATTAFVMDALTVNAGVTSFNGRAGAITLTTNDVSAAGGAPLVSPPFSGQPTAPTPTQGDNSTRLATTAYVLAAVAGVAGVASFNGRTGAVTLTTADVSNAGGPYLALAGGTMTGPLTAPAWVGNLPSLNYNGAAGTTRGPAWSTGGVIRWSAVASSTAESGSNAGSDFLLNRYSDTGASLGAGLGITRASGLVTIGAGLTMNGALTGCTNINNATTGSIAGITMASTNLTTAGTVTAQVLATTGTGTLNANTANIGSVTFQGGGNFVSPGTLTSAIISATQTVYTVDLVVTGTFTASPWLQMVNGDFYPLVNNSSSCGVPSQAWFQVAAYAFAQQSDQRGKKDIATAPPGALVSVEAIPVHEFHWPQEDVRKPRHIGWLAQEVQTVLPPNVLVGKDENQTLSVDLGSMVATLWQAVQELTARVAVLEA